MLLKINYEILERFLDNNGKVKQFPSKLEKKECVVAYIASKFTVGETYEEVEVNNIIRNWILFSDYVTIRRFLIDYKILRRDKYGKKYEVINNEKD